MPTGVADVASVGPLLVSAGQQRLDRVEQVDLVVFHREQVVAAGGDDRRGGGFAGMRGVAGEQATGQVHAGDHVAQLRGFVGFGVDLVLGDDVGAGVLSCAEHGDAGAFGPAGAAADVAA